MPSELSPAERTLRARLAAHSKWATHDPVEGTAKARQTFRDQFEDQVDPDRILPAEERARRAASARKAYYTRLALKSAQARRRNKEVA